MREHDTDRADVRAIEKEIKAGLPNDRERLDESLYALEYFHGDFSRFPVRDSGDRKWERTSLFMQRVVKVLAKLLYRAGPTRTLTGHPEATAWLEHIYDANAVDALLLQADRLTFVSDVALLQVEPHGDPDCPVKIRLWDASSFCVWCDPDEPTVPVAVATIDRYDQTRRLRLWTAGLVVTYQTEKWSEGATKTAGATAYRLVETAPNTLGVVPFVAVHYEVPTCDFWTPGPGCHLRQANDCINKRLTDLFDSARAGLDPTLVVSDAPVGWRPKQPKQPGDVWFFDTRVSAAGEAVATPKGEYLQADSSFVAAGWDDLNDAIDHVLEMCGVPPGSVRMTATTVASGDALVAEQIEPVSMAEGRQSKAAREEKALAQLVLTVGARHLGSQTFAEYTATARQLDAAAREPGFTVQWPSLFPDIPGPAADLEDEWDLGHGLTSLTLIAAKRLKLSEAEAIAHLERVAKDRARERALFGEPEPAEDSNPDPKAKGKPDPGTDDDGIDETDDGGAA